MDNTILLYRAGHPNCKWCKYYESHSRCFGEFYWEECILKDKYIKEKVLRALLCSYYKVKCEEENNEIQINKTH